MFHAVHLLVQLVSHLDEVVDGFLGAVYRRAGVHTPVKAADWN